MTSKTYCKHILTIIILTLSFPLTSFSQTYFKPLVVNRFTDNYPDKVTPNFDKHKVSYGVHLGLNTATFTSSLGHDFPPALGFSIGFEVAYRKICGFINGSLSFGKTSREFNPNGILPQRKPYSYGLTEFSLGYLAFESDPWKLCPFVGYSISEISVRGLDAETSKVSLSKFCTIIGVSIDYKAYGNIFIRTKKHHQDYLEFNVRTKLYGSYLNYDENAKGCSINLMVGLSLVKRPLTVKGVSSRQSSPLYH